LSWRWNLNFVSQPDSLSYNPLSNGGTLLADLSISRIVVEHKDRATRFGFRYKATFVGIQVCVTEESYTSNCRRALQARFLDDEPASLAQSHACLIYRRP
jgi:hypothetical protein